MSYSLFAPRSYLLLILPRSPVRVFFRTRSISFQLDPLYHPLARLLLTCCRLVSVFDIFSFFLFLYCAVGIEEIIKSRRRGNDDSGRDINTTRTQCSTVCVMATGRINTDNSLLGTKMRSACVASMIDTRET